MSTETCKYCHYKSLPEDTWEADFFYGIIGDTEYIPCEDVYYNFQREIDFCPRCGRKLKEVEK